MALASDKVSPTNGGRRRLPSFFEDQEPDAIQSTYPYSVCVEGRPSQALKKELGVENRNADLLPEPVFGGDAKSIRPYSESRITDSSFSRHDSLFSFGVPPTRNAAELRSLLGNSSARLRPGATILPYHSQTMDNSTQPAHTVSLERAKSRPRVEVDIVLESDCCISGGYLRGHVKLRILKRQKKEAPVLLADGRIRVIGFECVPSTRDYHTFYQRASALSAITDAYARIYDSPPDTEGFSRVMEGVHVLPFAMHLSDDDMLGSAKGTVNTQSGAALRYIVMVSVKVKDSKTLKRSIAHFYRDCEVWPRLNLNTVLASPSRPIQASSAKNFSIIGGGGQLKLTAMLHRSTWMAGQRCYVRIGLSNGTKKIVKTIALTLIRTTTLFKHRPIVESRGSQSLKEDVCQTTTSHKVVAESYLEKSRPASKHHASTEGWWMGVGAGEDTCFAHYVLIPSDALSVSRSRLIEVEYSIRVTASAGALAPDVHVTLPLCIINFLSVDPTPSGPLLSSDGSYSRLVPLDHSPYSVTPIFQSDTDDTIQYTFSEVSTISIDPLSTPPVISPLSGHHHSPPARATPASPSLLYPLSGHFPVPEPSSAVVDPQGHGPNTTSTPRTSPGRYGTAVPPTSEFSSSMYSPDSLAFSSPTTPTTSDHTHICTPGTVWRDLDLHDGADSDEEIASIIHAVQTDPRPPQRHGLMKSTGSPRTPLAATFGTSLPTIVRDSPAVHHDPSPTSPEESSGSPPAFKNPGDYEGINGDESATPTLRPSTASRIRPAILNSCQGDASPPISVSEGPYLASSRHRPPSRSLPQPPLQPQPLSDIGTARTSSRKALRSSRPQSFREGTPGSSSATDIRGRCASAVHTTSSNGSLSAAARRSPPIPHTRPRYGSPTATHGSNGLPLRSSRMPHRQSRAVPASPLARC